MAVAMLGFVSLDEVKHKYMTMNRVHLIKVLTGILMYELSVPFNSR